MKTSTIVVLSGVLCLFLQPGEGFSEEHCRSVTVDYQRKCGKVANVNSLVQLNTKDNCAEIEINAKSHWNASGIMLAKGVEYEVEVLNGETATWCDASIQSTAEGWKVADSNTGTDGTCPITEGQISPVGPKIHMSGLQKWFFLLAQHLRREKDSDWFKLIGVVVGAEYQQQPIGKKGIVTPLDDGEFCSFANDLSATYGNNSGTLHLKITHRQELYTVQRP